MKPRAHRDALVGGLVAVAAVAALVKQRGALRRSEARYLTEQRRAAAAREQLAREQIARQAAAERGARLRALHDAALALAGSKLPDAPTVAALLTRVVADAAHALDAADGVLVLVEDPAWENVLPGSDPQQGAVWIDARGRLQRRRLRSGGATARALQTGETVIVPETAAHEAYQALAARGIRSLVVVPLQAGEQTLGTLSLHFEQPGPLREEALELLALFAAHAAAALDRVRLTVAQRQLGQQADQLVQQAAEAAALRELDRLKDELLATVSHELRTPLTVVHGYARMLQMRGPTLDAATTVRMAERIATASSQLRQLVEDILDFGRLQRGEVTLRAREFDLAALLRDLVTEWRGREGGERLRGEWPDRLAARGDPQRVTQAIDNLLENAMRYAPEGTIVLRARLTGPDRRTARIEVEDQGPGISPADQPRVWEKFFRGAGVAELNVARGSGIGLAVVKALVEAQGGHVGLESTPGLGARFWFELPGGSVAAVA